MDRQDDVRLPVRAEDLIDPFALCVGVGALLFAAGARDAAELHQAAGHRRAVQQGAEVGGDSLAGPVGPGVDRALHAALVILALLVGNAAGRVLRRRGADDSLAAGTLSGRAAGSAGDRTER